MKAGPLRWIAAIAVSGILHAGAAALFLSWPQNVEIEGGGAVEIAMAGNAFVDQVSAGAVTDIVEPVTEEAAETQLVEADQVAPEAVEAASLIRADEAAKPSQAASARSPATEDARPSEPPEATPAASEEVAEVSEPNEANRPEVAVATARRSSESEAESITSRAPTKPSESTPQANEPAAEADEIAPAQQEAVTPAKAAETVTAAANIPIPTPRPPHEPIFTAEKEDPKPREAKNAPTKKNKAGSGGRNKADAKRGNEQGAQRAQASRQGKPDARATASGNAEVSNYPGKVVSRLRRALRYPSEARRKRPRGEVHVSFTISRNGGVGSVRVARSSGSQVLDRAAVDTVRRAAPFPAIPSGAGRSSWPFTVPLGFVR